MRVLLQMRPAPDVVAAVSDPGVRTTAADVAGDLPGVELDPDFEPVALPRPVPAYAGGDPLSLNQPLVFSVEPDDASILVRGEIGDTDVATRTAMLCSAVPEVVGVYADPVIATCTLCANSPALGSADDVARLLSVEALHAAGLDGTGVPVAIVDTGMNCEHLTDKLCRSIAADGVLSWDPPGTDTPAGKWPVNHGTMCAFCALIAAPQATLVDVAVLKSPRHGDTRLDGLLSDAITAYGHLRTVLDAMPAEHRALVVNNSWGAYSPDWDFPAGHPGNFSDNPAHPFNLIVASLEQAGADIVFAAGNCGRDCADKRCGWPSRPIAGANSHHAVLTVGAVDINGDRIGYSSQGPGRLHQRKPDVCAYAHFAGSRVFGANAPDPGTSAAAPVAAGVVAAVRTQYPAGKLSPAQLRTLLRRTADDKGEEGFDHDYGYGVLDPAAVLAALRRRRDP